MRHYDRISRRPAQGVIWIAINACLTGSGVVADKIDDSHWESCACQSAAALNQPVAR